MLQSILLATDFRPASLEATRVAEQLASVFGSRLTLYHIFHPMHPSPTVQEEERELATWELQELARQLASKNVVVAESMVATGHPAAMIVRQAQEIEADLILIGAGKWSGRGPFFLGPIAESVVHHAAQAVIVVRPGEPKVTFGRILCPVDHSTVSYRGLQTAIGLAKAFGGRLHVLSVVPDLRWLHAAVETGKFAGAAAEYKQQWREEFTIFLNSVEFGDVPYTRETRTGVAGEEIAASAREHRADLIIMGSTGRSGLSRLLVGSVTRRVLQNLPCSLLTVKQEEVAGQLLEDDIRHVNLLVAEGRELLAAESYPLALTKFRQALGYNPMHIGALDTVAQIYEKLGPSNKAELYRRRAGLVR
jgi:nucleotide-binding universal stress UspA family protein